MVERVWRGRHMERVWRGRDGGPGGKAQAAWIRRKQDRGTHGPILAPLPPSRFPLLRPTFPPSLHLLQPSQRQSQTYRARPQRGHACLKRSKQFKAVVGGVRRHEGRHQNAAVVLSGP
eukprot:350118-Chlamydomonas_euryale.AAC.1